MSVIGKGISILSLNVCGLKSKLKVPEFINLCKSHDLLCFSEIRCDEIDMQNVKDSFDTIGFLSCKKQNRCTKIWWNYDCCKK